MTSLPLDTYRCITRRLVIFAQFTVELRVMQNERVKWVSCHRGMFPDAPVPLNPDGSYSESPAAVLIVEAQKHCGQYCPSNCGYRQVIESLGANKIKSEKI